MSDFYLASHSPRRMDLLRQVGARFETLLLRAGPPRGPEVDELRHDGEPPLDYARRVAREKATQGLVAVAARSLRPQPVLGADTIVMVDGDILAKPQGAAQAAAFLRRLSGRTHEVATAVAVALPARAGPSLLAALSVSRVTMRALDDAEIERYCATGEPFNKAGGYAIQGRAAIFVDRLEGSYSGVVGLPLAETAALLAAAGVRLL
jgi:septum formation protein